VKEEEEEEEEEKEEKEGDRIANPRGDRRPCEILISELVRT